MQLYYMLLIIYMKKLHASNWLKMGALSCYINAKLWHKCKLQIGLVHPLSNFVSLAFHRSFFFPAGSCNFIVWFENFTCAYYLKGRGGKGFMSSNVNIFLQKWKKLYNKRLRFGKEYLNYVHGGIDLDFTFGCRWIKDGKRKDGNTSLFCFSV